jgi:hypothetical protein
MVHSWIAALILIGIGYISVSLRSIEEFGSRSNGITLITLLEPSLNSNLKTSEKVASPIFEDSLIVLHQIIMK